MAPSRTADATDAVFLQSMKTWSAQRGAARTSALDMDVAAVAAELEPMELASVLERGDALVPGLCKGSAMAAASDDGDGSCAPGLSDDAMLGKRVRIHGLQSKSVSELNGRVGLVTAFDSDKGRFRVRVDPADDDVESGKPRVLAFKAANLEALPS